MQRTGSTLAVVVLLVALAGCHTRARRPVIRDAQIVPAELKPGDAALITVDIADRYGIVDRVEGVVREDPRITFQLRDDGIGPDEAAGDGTWTLKVDVPFQAPPGEFELEFTAFRSDGQPILVRDADGDTIPLSGTFGMVIRYPETP